MTVIAGTHSRPGEIQVVAAPSAPADGTAVRALAPEAADLAERSEFKYLTIDPTKQNFNALLPQSNNGEIAKVIQDLKELADAIIEDADATVRNSQIPIIYTYWGQFIDHDITAGTDRAANSEENLLGTDILDENFGPQKPSEVEAKIINIRLPQLDLDSVYGGGPDDPGAIALQIYQSDNVHLNLGENTLNENIPPISSARIPHPELDETLPPQRDLPRTNRLPNIADARNDENLIVAQFHVAFLRFHNEVVKKLEANKALRQDPIFDQYDLFSAARQIVTWHYQWLVVNDYLETVANQQIVREIVASNQSFFEMEKGYMPLEFSVAGFRFGHSMIRNGYDFNMNFGNGAGLPSGLQPLQPFASLVNLFEFTGKVGFRGAPTLPVNWIIDWNRATTIDQNFPNRSAQKIDTNLAISLGNLTRETHDPLLINKNLARRNLLRGYLLSIPAGQHVADFLKVKPLTTELLPSAKPKVKSALEKSGFQYKTPLWYYILREAEVQTDGETLGEVGTRLVAGTLVGMIKADPTSYLNKGWDPSHATAITLGADEEIRKIGQFLQFAKVAPIPNAPVATPVAAGVA